MHPDIQMNADIINKIGGAPFIPAMGRGGRGMRHRRAKTQAQGGLGVVGTEMSTIQAMGGSPKKNKGLIDDHDRKIFQHFRVDL